MKGTYVSSPPAPVLADDVVLGPVVLTEEERERRRGTRVTAPPGAVVAHTMATDRDGVFMDAEEQLGRAMSVLMVTGDLTLWATVRADGEISIRVQKGESGEEGYERLLVANYTPELGRFHQQRPAVGASVDRDD